VRPWWYGGGVDRRLRLRRLLGMRRTRNFALGWAVWVYYYWKRWRWGWVLLLLRWWWVWVLLVGKSRRGVGRRSLLGFLGRPRLLADRPRRAIGHLPGSECGVYQATNRRLFGMSAMLVIWRSDKLIYQKKKEKRERLTGVP